MISRERERCQKCLISRKTYNYTNSLKFMLAVYIEERNIVKPNETLPFKGRKNSDYSFFAPNGQDMAPSVIYIDQVEQVFQATKKKKGADSGTAPSRIKKDLRWLLDDWE